MNARTLQMRTPSGRGRFYRRLKNGRSICCGPSSARLPDGSLSRDPDVYIPIVRDKVCAPFDAPRESPGLPSGRGLRHTERRSGLPFWWDSMYAFNACAGDPAAWVSLMEDCTTQEILSALRGADADKAPGFDGVTVDLLKVATGAYGSVKAGQVDATEPNPLLLALACVVNSCIRFQVCPPNLKRGGLCQPVSRAQVAE